MSRPSATILIPLRRQADEWLEHAVRSALEQTVPCEVLVVVSAETPGSNIDILDRLGGEYGDDLRVERGADDGFAARLNVGFRSASASRVGLLFSDDWLEPGAAEAALAVDADIVSAGKRIWSDDGRRPLEFVREVICSDSGLARCSTVEEQARYITHFLLMERSAVLAVGGVDETLGDLSGVDDYDLIWTLLERGATVGFAQGSAYNVRDHHGPRLTLRAPAEQVRSLRRILVKHGLDAAAQAEIIALHRPWYGRRISDVIAERVNDA
jgi:glycosyltransferase involved in cell wall biosynthesis